jgi:formate dehydrogenase maturation protein FdhE
LLALKETHPELAEAVDLHLALLDLQRRLLPRIPLPVLDLTPEQMAAHQARGLAVLTFDSIPVEVTDLRLLLRQTADVLHRFGMLEVDDFTRVQALGRDTGLLAQICDWFERSVERHAPSSRRAGGTTEEAPETGMLDYVIALAMKPYLTRCAEVLQPRQELALWTHGHCALCGGEPDLAVITPAAERHLICGQCSLHWNFATTECTDVTYADDT